MTGKYVTKFVRKLIRKLTPEGATGSQVNYIGVLARLSEKCFGVLLCRQVKNLYLLVERITQFTDYVRCYIIQQELDVVDRGPPNRIPVP